VDFDSHTSDTVAMTVDVVNFLTPGHARGREYAARATPDEVRDALRGRSKRMYTPTAAETEELRGYAARLRTTFAAVDEGRVDDACTAINELLRDTGAMPVLARHDDAPWHLHFHAVDAAWAPSWVAPMATALAVVLGNPMFERLGVCSAPVCDRVFVDTSRNGTRRFCSTACQNRVKASAFRARRKTA
jgi:predicted RNA-binding Zn ribbon-like protein